MIASYRQIADDFHHFTVKPLTHEMVRWLATHCGGDCSVTPKPPLMAFVVLYRASDAVSFLLRYGSH